MKKLLILVLVLLLCLAGTAMADVYPGDTVTVNLSVVSNADKAAIATVKFSFDSSVLEYQSANASYGMKPGSASGAFTISNLDGIPTGNFGSITFKVKADAKPGTYPVTAYVSEALNNAYQSVSLKVSGDNVVVDCVHVGGDPVRENIKDATCGDEGSYDEVVYCSKCDEEMSREAKTIPATGEHVGKDPVRENIEDATCGEDGSYDEVVYCSKCDEEMRREAKTIPATGEHTYGEWVQTKDPTVDEEGEETRTCPVCGDEETRPVDKLDPAPSTKPSTKPTAKPPVIIPTQAPTDEPTEEPTEEPTQKPTEEPTEAPTEEPTEAPTEAPTEEPTEAPVKPTQKPSEDDDDVPKTGDNSIRNMLIVGFAMMFAAIQLAMRVKSRKEN